MTLSDLMGKLLSCGAIERNDNDSKGPYFTPEFTTYLKTYTSLNRDKIAVTQGWRAMLAGFHISSVMLSDDELALLIRLLEFHSNGKQSAAISS